MAAKKNTKVKKAEWKGYHSVNLTIAQEGDFDLWCLTEAVQLTDLEPLLNNGYKLSFAWDNYHQGVSASMYCVDAKMEWAGFTLTAWAADVETALKLLFYKHFVICSENWDVSGNNTERTYSRYG